MLLLERSPDPGALAPLGPDRHTEWGASEVTPEDIVPGGSSLIARRAMVDVGLGREAWHARVHPWEGGSDHDVFLEHGSPAVLLWHFTDFAYHTSLDRMEHVDGQELELTTCALFAAAMAIADPTPQDLDRYLRTLSLERNQRVYYAEQAEDEALTEAWLSWFTGARHWLRQLCHGLPLE
jgi:hypothetical protein